MITYNLYGLKKEETKPYLEDLLLTEKPLSVINALIPLIESKGFHNLRICKVDLTAIPNFINTINLK